MIPQNDAAPDEVPPNMARSREAESTENDVPSSDDPMGTRIIYVIVAMVVLMFIVALGLLFEVARRRPA